MNITKPNYNSMPEQVQENMKGVQDLNIKYGTLQNKMVYVGKWMKGRKYIPQQVVEYNGSSYACIATVYSVFPPNQDTTHFELFVSEGEKGKDGANGKDGVNGTDGKNGEDGNGIEEIESGTPTINGEYTYTPIAVRMTKQPTQNFEIVAKNGENGADGQNGTNGTDGISITNITAGAPTSDDNYTYTPITFNFSDGTTKQITITSKNGINAPTFSGNLAPNRFTISGPSGITIARQSEIAIPHSAGMLYIYNVKTNSYTPTGSAPKINTCILTMPSLIRRMYSFSQDSDAKNWERQNACHFKPIIITGSIAQFQFVVDDDATARTTDMLFLVWTN